jgi:hypothetical protein
LFAMETTWNRNCGSLAPRKEGNTFRKKEKDQHFMQWRALFYVRNFANLVFSSVRRNSEKTFLPFSWSSAKLLWLLTRKKIR